MPPQLQHPWNLAVQELEAPLQLPFLAESGDPLVRLRAAAIVKEHWVYMFNLDESPATCDILSPFACSYKAKVSAEGVSTMKTLSVKHVACSMVQKVANLALVQFLVSSSQSTRHRGRRCAKQMMLGM